MSDEDRDVDIESDEEDDDMGGTASQGSHSQADKRAHHNALERKRRDHIKFSFMSLRDAVPDLLGEKVSRAQILKRAAEYIQRMREKNSTHQRDIETIKKTNHEIEQQIKALEKYGFTSRDMSRMPYADDGRAVLESSDEDEGARPTRTKRLKTAGDS